MSEDSDSEGEETARCRDELMLNMAKLPPMTHAQLRAKLAAERVAKKGREPKPAPKSKPTA